MSTNLHVGRHIVQTTSGSDSSVIPPGSLGATVAPTGIVGLQLNPSNNQVTVNGLAVGTATVTYTAAGYTNAQDMVTVLAPPQIVVTDGPEI